MLPLRPYSRTYYSSPQYYHYVRGYRQAPPFNIPSQVYIERNRGIGVDGRSWSWGPGSIGPIEVHVSNQAYEAFVNKLGDSSSFGATLTAELKETLGLVTGTVLRLVSAARKIRRLNFLGAAADLGLPYSERTIVKRRKTSKGRVIVSRRRVFTLPTGREVLKTLANGWLMYSYGVKPLATDIYNGLDVLQRPWPDEKVRVTRKGSMPIQRVKNSNDWSTSIDTYEAKVRVSCGAFVSVANPNLFLLNRMGLTNPVQWVNEAIPLSFIADWFSNLSSVIGGITDFVGLNIRSAWTSTKYDMKQSFVRTGVTPEWAMAWNKERHILSRNTALPTPKLLFQYERVQWQRALNAISLLIGLLPSGKS